MNRFPSEWVDRQPSSFLFVLSIAVVIGTVILIIATHPTFDYTSYIHQWRSIWLGASPWPDIHTPQFIKGVNVYGPIYNLFAYVYVINYKLPHLLFAASWYGVAIYLLRQYERCSHIPSRISYFFWVLLMFSPVSLVFVSYYGVNDAIMAALTGLGLYHYQQRRELLAGVALGFAIAIKFIPLCLLPFLMIERKKIHSVFSLTVLATLALIFAVAWLKWGNNILSPFISQHQRHPVELSIFHFLEGAWSPLRWWTPHPSVGFLSAPLTVAALLILFFLHIRYQFPPLLSAVVALVVVLMFNTVGHEQFFLTVVMAITVWCYADYAIWQRYSFNCQVLWTYLVWIMICCSFCFLAHQFKEFPLLQSIRENLALPTFLLQLAVCISAIRWGIRQHAKPLPA